MSPLSPRLHLKVQQKQILTPGLVQMVTVLQLNRLELRDMIAEEIAQNPVLEDTGEGAEELTPAEVQALLEAERAPDPSDAAVLQVTNEAAAATYEGESDGYDAPEIAETAASASSDFETQVSTEAAQAADPFDQIDFGSYFEEWMDPGFRSPAAEDPDKPGFETFLSSPVTLTEHLRHQLALLVMAPEVRDAADAILGNLDDTGYLSIQLDEIALSEGFSLEALESALEEIQCLEPAGVGARSLQECLLLQLESRNARGSVAWQIVENHLKLVESKSVKDLCRLLGRPAEHILTALDVIRHLDPKPGIRYSGPGARQVAPDVYITKDGEDYIIQISDEDLPQLRLNGSYRRLLDRQQEPDKETRNYIKERFQSALQLIRNIEQRKQTIVKVCQAIVGRQAEFLEHGLDQLRPMMIKDVAEEIGVHPSTVSRAVSGKYAHTPQGVFELRFFFSEAVQGPSGGGIPLQTLKRMVKKMIDEEDPAKPLTDDHIAVLLQGQGIEVTRRTVAKYREDMKIPSTHHRRVRN
ncbi:MAG: RNA polymerase factor sigma-54 [Candidatus Solibacter usitatus]|nr:RNA polymerase factor sigma-54 [Candidatus Solibacter usitatus]